MENQQQNAFSIFPEKTGLPISDLTFSAFCSLLEEAFDSTVELGAIPKRDYELTPKLVKETQLKYRDFIHGLKDTEGALLIACGETPDEVREGLLICESVHATCPRVLRRAVDAMYDVHRIRAYRRILDLERQQ